MTDISKKESLRRKLGGEAFHAIHSKLNKIANSNLFGDAWLFLFRFRYSRVHRDTRQALHGLADQLSD